MKQSAKTEARDESLDLERFVRVVRNLPTVPKSEIDKILADGKAKHDSRTNAQLRKKG